MGLESLERATAKLSNPNFLEELFIESASNYEAELIDMNTGALEDGVLSDGNRTTPYENPDYEEMKRSEGSKSLPYADYNLDGDFYKGWKVDFKSDKMVFDSSDDKTSKLERRDKNLFGIRPKDRPIAVKMIAPTFINKIRNEFTKD